MLNICKSERNKYLVTVNADLNEDGNDYMTPDGTAVRDYIHVTDLARGHLAALNSRSKNGFHVYNLGIC